MTKTGPSTPLRQVLTQRREFVLIDDLRSYKRCRAQSRAQGVVLRDIVQGSEIRTKQQQVCRSGDFLVAEIDAKVGGFGSVPDDLDGAIVSSHYFLFEVDETQVDRRFLGYFVRTPAFQSQVAAVGTTNYAAIRPNDFLSYRIPLPELCEQRRIADQFDQFTVRFEELKSLAVSIARDLRSAQLRAFEDIVSGAVCLSMVDVAPLVRRSVIVDSDLTYHEIGIRSFGNGTFHKTPTPGASLGTKRIFRVAAGDLLFNIVFAWEGAVAVATPLDDGWCGSHRFLTCVPNPDTALARYLCFYFLTEAGLRQLGEASPGGAGRNRTLGLKALERIRVPIPTLPKQRWFVELLDRFDEASRLQREVSASLEALMPAVLDRAFRGEL